MVRPGAHTWPVNKLYVYSPHSPSRRPSLLLCYYPQLRQTGFIDETRKKLGFFMSRVHSSSLPLALDNAYMCAVRCLPLLVFKVYGDSDRRKTEEICLSWFCRVLVRSNDKLEFKKSTIYAQFIHNHHYYKDKWIISKERSKDDTRCN